jgi:hypothetical protein
LQQFGNVVGCNVDVRNAWFERSTGIARRDEYSLSTSRLSDFPGERMLAAAAAQDQDAHV